MGEMAVIFLPENYLTLVKQVLKGTSKKFFEILDIYF